MNRLSVIILMGIGLGLAGCKVTSPSWQQSGVSERDAKEAEKACWNHVLKTKAGKAAAKQHKDQRWNEEAASGLASDGLAGLIAAPIGTGLGLAIEEQIADDNPKKLEHNRQAFNDCMEGKGYHFQ